MEYKSRVEALKERQRIRKIKRRRFYLFIIIISTFILSLIVVNNNNGRLVGEKIKFYSFSSDKSRLNFLGYNIEFDPKLKEFYFKISDKILNIIKK